ncbi:hypothetical protein KC19_5G104600 [Ceratodon purpureus]|uniref:EamA domain-containing protein n=1 Tax=Ceratodon purpureus TaxID=3225 RepID=A0A8T0I0V8_CERPU|nr:hypothetical protein KC19_5G104600 [Ceratodon purpureus]
MDHMQVSSACRPRSSTSTSFCRSGEVDCGLQRWRFCLGQSKFLQEESWAKLCVGSESVRSLVGKAIRCRVIRDERDGAFVLNSRREKQGVQSSQHWLRRDGDDTRVGTLLSWDEFKEDRYGIVDGGDPIAESFREDSSYGRLSDDDEAVDSGVSQSGDAPLPLDSRVETFEGIPVRQWLSTFVKSVDPRLRGIIILNLLTFLYGSSIAVIKETESVLDPASFSVGRFAIAAIVFAPFLKDALQPGISKAGLELGVWASIGYLSQALGLMTTDAGRASFFTTFTVLTVPFIAGLTGKKIPLLTWCAAVAALFGVGLLETTGAPPSVGDAWSLLSSVIFGIHLIRTEHYSRIVTPMAALPIISIQLSVITASSLMWSLASHVTSGGSVFPDLYTLDWPSLYQSTLSLPFGSMLYTGLFSTAFCLCAELVAMRDVSATEAAVITTLEPLWGAAFAWCILGERWGLRGWVGAAFILGGSLATQIWGSPETPVKRTKVPLPTLEEQEAERQALLIKPPVHNLEKDRMDKHRSSSRRRK